MLSQSPFNIRLEVIEFAVNFDSERANFCKFNELVDSVRARIFKEGVLLRKRMLSGEVRPVVWEEPSDDEAEARPMRNKIRLSDCGDYQPHRRFNVDQVPWEIFKVKDEVFKSR